MLRGTLALPTALACASTMALATSIPSSYHVVVPIAFGACGIAFTLLQASAFVLVEHAQKVEGATRDARRLATGLHFGFLDVCVGAGAVISPPAATLLARLSPRVPLCCAALAHGVIALLLQREVRRVQGQASGTAEERTPLLPEKVEVPSDPVPRTGVARALLSHPWTWIVGLAAAVSAASIAFVRPLLLSLAWRGADTDPLVAAWLLSLVSLVCLVAPPLAAALAAPRFGTRAVFVACVTCMACGFRVLAAGAHTTGLVIGMAGASAASAVALTEVVRTSDFSIDSPLDAAAIAAAMLLAFAEFAGTIAFLLLANTAPAGIGPLRALNTWAHLVTLSAIVVIVPFIVGSLAQCIAPVTALIFVRDEFSDPSSEDAPPQSVRPHTLPLTPMGSHLSLALGRSQP